MILFEVAFLVVYTSIGLVWAIYVGTEFTSRIPFHQRVLAFLAHFTYWPALIRTDLLCRWIRRW